MSVTPPPIREITLKQVFEGFVTYAGLVRARWRALVLGGLLGLLIAATLAHLTPDSYRADLTFLVDQELSSGSAVGGLLSAIGIGSGGGEVNAPKVIALARSEFIIHGVLLDTVACAGARDLLANCLIASEGLVDELDLEESGVTRIDRAKLDAGDRGHRRLLRKLYTYVVKDPGELVSCVVDDDSGIFKLSSKARDEQHALLMTELVYDRLSAFYNEEVTAGRRNTVAMLEEKTDSLARELSGAEYQLATLQDTRLALTQQRDRVRQQSLQRQLSILTLAYGEVLKNLETARFTLASSTPYFQIIDRPYDPLPLDRAKVWLWGLLGAVAGAAVAYLVVASRFYVRSVMHDDAAADR